MRHLIRKSGQLILVLSAAALAILPASCRRTESVERGRAIFAGYGCARCHQIGGQGGVLGPDLSYVGFRKSREWLDLWLENPHGWKRNTIMPHFNFPEGLRKDLVDYLSSLKGQAFEISGRPWEKEEDPLEKGKVLFAKAGCVGCHGPSGKGGYPNNNVTGGKIPSLTLVADGYSKDELKERIAKGRLPDPADPSQPAPMIQMPAWEEVLKEHEIEALVEYLYSLRPAGAGDSW